MSDFEIKDGALKKYTGHDEAVVIPAGVTSIGNDTFRGCNSLSSVEISDSVTSIGDGAFWGCHSLSSVEIPVGVTSIGERAFYDCGSLSSVEIPEIDPMAEFTLDF